MWGCSKFGQQRPLKCSQINSLETFVASIVSFPTGRESLIKMKELDGSNPVLSTSSSVSARNHLPVNAPESAKQDLMKALFDHFETLGIRVRKGRGTYNETEDGRALVTLNTYDKNAR